MELIKDYDLTIHYKPGRANVVADALSRMVVAPTVVTQTTTERVVNILRLAYHLQIDKLKQKQHKRMFNMQILMCKKRDQ